MYSIQKEFNIQKEFIIAAAHRLYPYDGPCGNLHGHNWKISIELQADKLNEHGMILDFKEIQSRIVEMLDHKTILSENDPLINILQPKTAIMSLPFSPTAENLAKWIGQQFIEASAVTVEESPNNSAIWIRG